MTSFHMLSRVRRTGCRQLLLPAACMLIAVACSAQDGSAASQTAESELAAWDPSKLNTEEGLTLGVGSGDRPLTGSDLAGRVRDTTGLLRPTTVLTTDWLAPSESVLAMRLVRPDSVHDTGSRITIEYQRVSLNGRALMLRAMSLRNAASSAGNVTDSVWFDPATLVPVRHRYFALDRDMQMRFDADSVRGEWSIGGGASTPFTHATETPLYASVMIDAIAASLPLTDGYTVKVPTYLYEAKGRVDARVTVLGADTLRVGGALRNVTKVEVKMEIGTPTVLWLDSATRELLRTSVSPEPGYEMRIEP